MATTNPFDLLGDDDVEDPTLFIAAQEQKVATAVATKKVPAAAAAAKPAKLPTKPVPPSQAVREARNDTGRGGGGGRGGRGYGRGRGPGGPNRDFANNENSFASDNGVGMGYKEDREKFSERRGGYGSPRGGSRGGRRGGFNNGGEAAEGERPRRVYERRSGTGRGNDMKREGSGRGNWGTPTDEIAPETEEPVVETEENVTAEKQTGGEENVDAEKENPVNESEEKEPEEKQMTLEEYEKVLEEKRKALLSLKVEERKVNVDKEFESMQLVSKKKNEDEVFIKLGSDKDKRREAAEKEERAKKSVSINEFLKPAEGETSYRGGGRGRGRGRSRGGGYSGGYAANNVPAPSIEDPSHFPTLGAK
uniref:Hyaluronan/mRNA-binding protein domain-containing protein n=1 Tax=Opuntia streptacantha TaxID=393608 RepID=A0A7C9EWN6_OPUST